MHFEQLKIASMKVIHGYDPGVEAVKEITYLRHFFNIVNCTVVHSLSETLIISLTKS